MRCSACLAVLLVARPSYADEPEPPRDDGRVAVTEVRGLADPGSEPGDGAREAANVALWIPRNVTDILFRGTSAAAGLIADEQIVPRYRELLGTAGGDIFLFPTLFAETDSAFSVGLRMIGDSRYVGTTARIGYGGPDDVALESRVRFKGSRGLPMAISLEGFYERASEREYHGIGITPEVDERNGFQPDAEQRVGLYFEKRSRLLGSIGIRLGDELELFLSASVQRREVRDSEDVGSEALSRVFVPASLPGALESSWIGYIETAARFDTRRTRGKPTKGFVLEGYCGGAKDAEGPPVAFMRLGTRASAFFPIYRDTNLLSPRVVLDRLIPLSDLDVPFTEMPRQPDFRGFDTRRDFISAVASLDYTWRLVPFMGMRLFLDAATVAPSVTDFGFEQIEHLRYTGGLGVDLFTDTSELGRFAVSAGPDGVRLLVSLGVPSDYGDRQHRD